MSLYCSGLPLFIWLREKDLNLRLGYERLDIGVYIQRSLKLLIVANRLYAIEIKDLGN